MLEDFYKQGTLLHIKDYEFQDGGGSKDKFILILTRNEQLAYVIHCLTTSQNNLNLPQQNFGCSVIHNIPYFFIPKSQALGGKNDFQFKKDTFIFFNNNIRQEEISKFSQYTENEQLSVKDVLPNIFLKRVLKCVLKSNFIPLGIIDELKDFKASL